MLVAQAIGRLRGSRGDEVLAQGELLDVELHGCVPVYGHGLPVPEFVNADHGRDANRRERFGQVAKAVVQANDNRAPLTRRNVADAMEELGFTPSNDLVDSSLAVLERRAIEMGLPVAELAKIVVDDINLLVDQQGVEQALATAQTMAAADPEDELLALKVVLLTKLRDYHLAAKDAAKPRVVHGGEGGPEPPQ